MTSSVAPLVDVLRAQVRHLPPVQRIGTVTGVAGLVIESDGPNVGLGEPCEVRSSRDDFNVRAEVVGFREHRVLLMPLGDMTGLHVGCEVVACEHPALPRPGPEMLGRVLDGLGFEPALTADAVDLAAVLVSADPGVAGRRRTRALMEDEDRPLEESAPPVLARRGRRKAGP